MNFLFRLVLRLVYGIRQVKVWEKLPSPKTFKEVLTVGNLEDDRFKEGIDLALQYGRETPDFILEYYFVYDKDYSIYREMWIRKIHITKETKALELLKALHEFYQFRRAERLNKLEIKRWLKKEAADL